jgi:hypothetical protein
MTKQVFAVHDSAAGAYLAPFVVHGEGLAVRMFNDLVSEPGHQFNKHPEDYTLFKIGRFDEATGELKSMPPQSYGNGLQFLSPKLEAVNDA